MDLLRRLWACIWRPRLGFAGLAEAAPGLWGSLGRMLLLRVPVAYVAYTFAVLQVTRSYLAFKNPDGEIWRLAMPMLTQASPELDLQEIKALLAQLPALPSLGTLLAWGLLVAPVGVLSVWLHDAAWDHGCLWLLGALKSRKGLRTTFIAESEALSVGVFGAALAFLGQIPWVGWILAPPIAVVGIWFWVLRGFSLAAFHKVPVWKGVVATLLHALLAGCCLVAMLGLVALLFFAPAG